MKFLNSVKNRYLQNNSSDDFFESDVLDVQIKLNCIVNPNSRPVEHALFEVSQNLKPTKRAE